MLRLYALLGLVATPLIRAWLARRAHRGKENSARMGERFGHASLSRPTGRLIWLHAASVGEAQSVLTLVRAITAHDTNIHLLITTGTVTSAALIAQQRLPNVIHQFVPVDTWSSVRRFLRHWRPDLALWIESEFWPQLLLQTKQRGIPLLLINARLSERSFKGWRRWPRSIARLLQGFDAIFAGSADDAARLRALGATDVIEAGNVKFDAAPLPVDADALATLTRQIGNRPLWLAASTHTGEESQVAHAHHLLLQQFPDLLTVIVPRHAVRGNAIGEELLQRGIKFVQRSTNEAIDGTVSIYLADTMGELGTFYHLAPIVFLGGSLIEHGGHNPLEPARQHCAILSGRHVHNFNAIMALMDERHALQFINDADDLATQVARLMQDAHARTALADHAQSIVAEARGASTAILARVQALLPGGL